jgi:hypothetical protein
MKRLLLFLIIGLSFIYATAQNKTIMRLESIQSLYIETYKDNVLLGSATGFIIRSKTINYLVTNYHVVTNKNAWDNAWMNPRVPITPNRIKIFHNGKNLGDHIEKFENLISPNGDTLWYRSKIDGNIVDVIELPLKDTSNTTIYPVNYLQNTDSLSVFPTDRVFMPGFALGLRSASGLAIWKSGFLASEPDLDQENKPIIWVDDIPFPGMSGSPVYLIPDQVIYKNGTVLQHMGGANQAFFLGVFSHGDSRGVYGALWKASFLNKTFDRLP